MVQYSTLQYVTVDMFDIWRRMMKGSERKKHQEVELTPDDVITDTERESIELLETVNATQKELNTLFDTMTESGDVTAFEKEVTAKVRSYKRATSNLLKSYYMVRSFGDELSARWHDLTKGRKRRLIPSAPANAVIDMEEKKNKHFAQGLNMYKLLILCYMGSFAGVVIEMLWCLLTRGYIESRAGLVYGPFNLLYGVGAVALTAALYKYRNKKRWISFLGGMAIGSVVEYVCSWGQELLFGSRSWDYSHMPFNINGRICLLYSVFWGVLGVLWVKSLYPRVAGLVLKLPDKAGKITVWVLTAFFIVNAAVTVLAVYRWSMRVDMVAPGNEFWEFIDARFPNERMERIFANMDFN